MIRFDNVLVAVGGDRHDSRVVELAAAILGDHGLLTLACAAPVVTAGPDADVYLSLQAVQERQALADRLTQEALDDAASHLPGTVLTRTLVLRGSAAGAILEELRSGEYDAVVAGHAPRGEISIILHGGSLAHRLLHHSPVPVVLVPSRLPQDSAPEGDRIEQMSDPASR